MHEAFLAKQKTFAFYRTHGLNLLALPGVFHPDPGSSSLFLLDAVLKHSRLLNPLSNGSTKPVILDLGCGSGVVGIGLGRYAKRLLLSDIDGGAVWCARVNALLNGFFPNCFQSDLFEHVPQQQFDLITFNIPLLQQPIGDRVEQTTNDPGGQLFQRFIQDLSRFLPTHGEAYLAYSTLGDMKLLDQIPDTFKIERIAEEAFPEIATERYVFCLTWQEGDRPNQGSN